MKRKWTEQEAVSLLTGRGAEVKGKMIICKNGVGGLKGCSAYSYLVNHCGYKGNLKIPA